MKRVRRTENSFLRAFGNACLKISMWLDQFALKYADTYEFDEQMLAKLAELGHEDLWGDDEQLH